MTANEREVLQDLLIDRAYIGDSGEFRKLLLNYGDDKKAVEWLAQGAREMKFGHLAHQSVLKSQLLLDYYAGAGEFSKFKTTTVVEKDFLQELLAEVKKVTERQDACPPCKCAAPNVRAGLSSAYD